LYFNTVSNTMFVYSGSSWAAAGSAVNGTAERQEYVATSGQTNFSATYDVGFVDVYLNGSKLIPTTDFTATDGATIVLGTGATTGDNVSIIAYGAFNVADVYTQAQSDARYTQKSNNLSDLDDAATALTNLGLTATATELNYTDGVTSNIQAQLDAAGVGSVTSVGGTGSVSGLTLTGTVTSSGNLTLGGTLDDINLASGVTGTLPAANGGTGITAAGASGNVLTSTGSGWASTAPAGGATSTSNVGLNGSSTLTITGIPSGVSHIWVNVYQMSNDNFGDTTNQIQLGTSGGIQTTSYKSAAGAYRTSGDTFISDINTALAFFFSESQSNRVFAGSVHLAKLSDNKWVMSSIGATDDTSGQQYTGGGMVQLSGDLTQIKLLTDGNGWDSGFVNISYM
jgi:hypothetical protein